MANHGFFEHNGKISARRFSVKPKQRPAVPVSPDNGGMEKTGKRIRDLRKERKLTQPQVTDATGIPQSTLSELERGESKVPTAEVLLKLAHFFEVEPAWILTGKGPKHIVSSSSDKETELLLYYRSLSAAGRDYLLSRARDIHADEHRSSPRTPSAPRREADDPDKLFQ